MSKLHLGSYHRYLDSALALIASLGIKGVQVMCTHPRQMPHAPQQLARRAAGLGLAITSLGAYHNIMGQTDEFVQAIDYAADADVAIVCTHSGTGSWSALVSSLQQLCDRAASRGVAVALENSPLHLVKTTEDLRRAAVAVKKLRINLDPANLNCAGSDPVAAPLVLGRKIVHTHAKDSVRNTLQFPELGKGDVPFAAYLRNLKRSGYRGYLVIEHEGPSHPLDAVRKGKVFLEQLMGGR